MFTGMLKNGKNEIYYVKILGAIMNKHRGGVLKMKEIKFTRKQEDYLCYLIGEWYLFWKDHIVCHSDKTHRLGVAKEDLKAMICNDIGNDIENTRRKLKIDE